MVLTTQPSLVGLPGQEAGARLAPLCRAQPPPSPSYNHVVSIPKQCLCAPSPPCLPTPRQHMKQRRGSGFSAPSTPSPTH